MVRTILMRRLSGYNSTVDRVVDICTHIPNPDSVGDSYLVVQETVSD